MLCSLFERKSKKKSGMAVYLNVYDLAPINGYAYWVGLGFYHSGIQVGDTEYAFSGHEHSTTGIYEMKPMQCSPFRIRKSILIGRTDMDTKQMRVFMDKLGKEYPGNSYNLILKNCNHFSNDACVRITGKSIPKWVNRLARVGHLCNRLLPAVIKKSLNKKKVRNVKGDKKKKLRRKSSVSLSWSKKSSKPRSQNTPPSSRGLKKST